MSHRVRIRLAAVAAALASSWAAAAGGPLSFADAQRVAVERSRQVAALGFGIDAARQMAVAAGQKPDPVVSLMAENVPIEGGNRWSLTADPMSMARLGISQELTRGEKLRLRAERYEVEARRNEAERDAALANVQRDAALAWLDTWYAEAMATAVAEQRSRALEEAEAAEAFYRAGRGTQADVFLARGAVAALDDRAAEIEKKLRTARTTLARWTGEEDPRRPLGALPDLDLVRVMSHGDEEIANHPELAMLARQADVALAEARIAESARTPDWTVQLSYGKRGSGFGDMATLGVSIPWPWDRANRQDREVAARTAAAEQARALREEAVRRHTAEVKIALDEWAADRERLVRYEREIVPLAAARAHASLAAYRGGKTTLAEVLAARRGQLEVRLQALQLANERARLWAQLQYLYPETMP